MISFHSAGVCMPNIQNAVGSIPWTRLPPAQPPVNKKGLYLMLHYFRVPAITAALDIFLNTITKADIKNILHLNSTSLVSPLFSWHSKPLDDSVLLRSSVRIMNISQKKFVISRKQTVCSSLVIQQVDQSRLLDIWTFGHGFRSLVFGQEWRRPAKTSPTEPEPARPLGPVRGSGSVLLEGNRTITLPLAPEV